MNLYGENFSETARNSDSGIDRSIIFPSAQTINSGDFIINNYEILSAGISFGVTDDFQLSFTTFPFESMFLPAVYSLSAKYRVISGSHFIFSIMINGIYTTFTDYNDLDNDTEDSDTIYSFGGGVSFIMDYYLNSNLYFSGGVFLPNIRSYFDNGTGGFNITSAVFYKISKYLKIMADINIYIYNTDEENVSATLFHSLGLRFSNKNFGIDLSAIGNFSAYLPYIVFSIRF
jgi:hypothetical protein